MVNSFLGELLLPIALHCLFREMPIGRKIQVQLLLKETIKGKLSLERNSGPCRPALSSQRDTHR